MHGADSPQRKAEVQAKVREAFEQFDNYEGRAYRALLRAPRSDASTFFANVASSSRSGALEGEPIEVMRVLNVDV